MVGAFRGVQCKLDQDEALQRIRQETAGLLQASDDALYKEKLLRKQLRVDMGKLTVGSGVACLVCVIRTLGGGIFAALFA